jgi:ABC-type antimicrobial peptide transport system permease subunit
MVDMTSPQKPITIWYSTPAPVAPVLENKIPEIEHVVRTSYPWDVRLEKGETKINKSVVYVDSVFFENFNFPLLKGNQDKVLDDRDAIVISNTLAESLFKNEDPIGKILTIKESFREEHRDVMITGVFEDIKVNSSLQFDVAMPFETFLGYATWNQHWGNYNNLLYVILQPDVQMETVNSKIRDFIKENRPDYTEHHAELFLHPLKKEHLYNDFSKGRDPGGTIVYIRLFSVVSYFVLIIAFINYVNLSTANASRRHKEVGLKKTIGATRKILIRQFLIESFVLNILSIIVAVILVIIFVPIFNQSFEKNVGLPWNTYEFYLFLTVFLLINTLLSGTYPAFVLSSFNPVKALRGIGLRSKNIHLRDSLVVFQFILSISLIIGILVVYKQVEYIRNKNLGFKKENVIRFNSGENSKHQEVFRNELLKIPGVLAVGYSNQNPLYVGNSTSDPKWDNKPEGDETFFFVLQTDHGFTDVLGIELLEGEGFPKEAHPSINHYLINERAAKAMDLQDPVGQNLTFWNDNEGKILGLVKDFHHQSLYSEIKPLIIYHQPESTWITFVRIAGNDITEVISKIESAYAEIEKINPFDYHFLDVDYANMYRREMLMQKLTLGLTILAVFISSLGLFGLALFTVNRQTKSIAIRKVNGARVDQIVLLLSRSFILWIIIALIIASPLSYYFLNEWLLNFAYRTSIEWYVFGLAGGTALIIALLTIGYQTLKAALANPVTALRYE